SGYHLTDTSADRIKFKIPFGTVIPPGGYLLVWADNNPGQNSTNSADLHVNFQLARGGEEIGLYNPEGGLVDLVTFGPQTNNVSEGCLPDGAAHREFFAQSTPRASNRVGPPNTAPTLNPIGSKAVAERSRLMFDATASDTEDAVAKLIFSLAPGAPDGAAITPEGRFTWRPTEAQGPGVFPVTIRVNDGGSPSLQTSENIQITVREINLPPVFPSPGTRYVKAEENLSFATGVDLDLPGQPVQFQIESKPIEGLTLNPSTGQVNWKPTSAQAGKTYQLMVAASDNGVPILTGRGAYTIVVLEASAAAIVVQATMGPAGIILTWPSNAGDRFQVEVILELGGKWTPVGPVIEASGNSAEFRSPASGLQQFFRVKRL
ncbi:MAG: hypothetical protein FJ405_13940, partial [Verrucomicrobia bacterium]|nr:hypothetical protein [Verrucomicrobiota bacterium]